MYNKTVAYCASILRHSKFADKKKLASVRRRKQQQNQSEGPTAMADDGDEAERIDALERESLRALIVSETAEVVADISAFD